MTKTPRKTTKTSKAAPKAPANSPTHESCLSPLEITDAFVKKQAKDWKSSGDNNYLHDFANVARMICVNYRTWSVNDLLAMTRSLDTPAQAIMALHNDWVAELKERGRLTSHASCYDFPQHTFR